jgi:ABC-type nitrate/sulfonate/bicarbonate transport system substrate-binding protein
MRLKRRISVIVGALLLASAAAPHVAHAQTPTPIRAAYVPVITWLPAWIAKDRGMFERNGLDVTLTVIQNLSLLPGTMGRQFEFGASTGPDLIKAAASGLDVVAVAGEVLETSERPSIQVIVRKDSGINSVKDLKGKLIATPSTGAIMHVATLAWLKKNGVDPASIRAVEVPFPNMGDQLKAGRVDAIESLQPFVGQLLAQGYVGIGNPLLSVADPVLFPFWISQGAWARANLPVIARWIKSLNEAKAFIEQNPAEARVILAKYTNLPPPVAQNIPFPTFDFSIQPSQIDVWVRTLRDLGQLGVTVDSSKLVVTPK